MRHKKNIGLIIILVIALIAILTIFIRFTGLSSTFKYFLMYLVIIFVAFGLSIWLNRKWISYLPTFFFIALTILFLVLVIITPDDQGLGRGLYVIFCIATIFLSGISYLSAILLDKIVINEESFEFQSIIMDYKEHLALVVGFIVLLNNISKLIKQSPGATLEYLGITIATVVLVGFYLILIALIYLLSKKRIDLFKASVITFVIYIPFSYLIGNMYRIIVNLGMSLGLIIIQAGLLFYIYRKSIKQISEDKVEDIL